jgi:hypothetical protein
MSREDRKFAELADHTVIGLHAVRLYKALLNIIKPPEINRSNPRHVRPL